MKPWIANLLGTATGAGVLAAGLAIGSPTVDAATNTAVGSSLAPPSAIDGATEISLGQEVELYGRPARLSLFWTTDEVEDISRTYIDTWKKAGIDPQKVTTIVITHFHADHISGLMAKDTNAPIFPNAEIHVPEAEYKFWTAPTTTAGAAKRIQAVFPGWKNIKPFDGERKSCRACGRSTPTGIRRATRPIRWDPATSR